MFFEFLFPRRCVFCNRVFAKGEKDLCVRCVWKLGVNLVPLAKFADRVGSLNVENYDVFMDFKFCRTALEKFKYGGRLYYGRVLAKLWVKRLKRFEWVRNADWIIPVPMSRWELLSRGFNQNEFLGGVLSKDLGVPLCRKAVVAKRKRTSQVESKDRWENIKGAFALNEKMREQLKGKRVIIIDDVITSSATVNEMLGVLRGIEGLRVSLAFLSMGSKF